MNAIRSLLTILFALFVGLPAAQPAFAQAPTAGGGRELVAVMDLTGIDARPAEMGALSEELRAQLLNSGKFRVVDRQQIETVLKEQALQQTGCTSQECAVQVGKVLGVRKMFTGRVTKISDNLWQIAAQLVDVESAETLRAVTVNQKGEFAALLTDGVVVLMGKLTAGIAAPVPVAAAAAAPAAGGFPKTGTLTGDQIRLVLSGNTMTGDAPPNGPFKARYDPDGKAVLDSGGRVHDGKWSIQGDKYCTQYDPSIRNGMVTCFGFKRVSTKAFQTIPPNGVPINVTLLKPPPGEPARTGPPRVAIFPIRRTGDWTGWDRREEEALGWITNAIINVAQAGGVEISHSVHLTNVKNPAMAGTNLGNLSDVKGNTWSFMGNPNIDFVVAKGRELGVEAVLLMNIGTGQSTGPLTIYLVDVESGAVKKESSTWPTTGGGRGSADIGGKVQTLFANFVANR